MNTKRAKLLLLAVPFIFASSIPAFADEISVNQDIDQLLGDHTKYQAVIVAFQQAVKDHDAEAVAALVDYPIGVEIKGKETNIKSAKTFEENYDAIMTPPIAKAVVDQQYGELVVNYKGIMFGDGQVWISGICTDNECKGFDVKIDTIQDTSNPN